MGGAYRVSNAVGTTDAKKFAPTWTGWWKDCATLAKLDVEVRCLIDPAIHKCSESKGLVGAHVYVEGFGDDAMFIIPACKGFNNLGGMDHGCELAAGMHWQLFHRNPERWVATVLDAVLISVTADDECIKLSPVWNDYDDYAMAYAAQTRA